MIRRNRLGCSRTAARLIAALLVAGAAIGCTEDARSSTRPKDNDVPPPPATTGTFAIRWTDGRARQSVVNGQIGVNPIRVTNKGVEELLNVTVALDVSNPQAVSDFVNAGKLPPVRVSFDRLNGVSGCFPLNIGIDFDVRAFTPQHIVDVVPGLRAALGAETLPSSMEASRVSLGYSATNAPTTVAILGSTNLSGDSSSADIVVSPHQPCEAAERRIEFVGAFQKMDGNDPAGIDLGFDFDREVRSIGIDVQKSGDVIDVSAEIDQPAELEFRVTELPVREDDARQDIVNGVTSELPTRMRVHVEPGNVQMINSGPIPSAWIFAKPDAADATKDVALLLSEIPERFSLDHRDDDGALRLLYDSVGTFGKLNATVGTINGAGTSGEGLRIELERIPSHVQICVDGDGDACVSSHPDDNPHVGEDFDGFLDAHGPGARPSGAPTALSLSVEANGEISMPVLDVPGTLVARALRFSTIRLDAGVNPPEADAHAYVVLDTDDTPVTAGSIDFGSGAVRLRLGPPGLRAQNYMAIYDSVLNWATGGTFSCAGSTLSIRDVPEEATDFITQLCS